MARTLRPVPDTPPRAVIYIRQSIARDESVSAELQEASCRDYARRQGYTVVDVIEDLGISGRTWKRPGVVRTLAMVEDGQADVILLWKWSRISRSRRDWAVAVDRVDVAGGRIESATEQVDVSTATGRLARGVLAEFAAFESDRIGEVWKEVQQSRLADGYAPNGKPRFGYQWDPVQKLHVPDPEAGPVLALAYRRYVAGASVYTLVRWLNSERVTTTAGNQWTDHSLRRVLDAGFAAGHIQWRGEKHPGRHERLIDDDLWQAYLDVRKQRRNVPAQVKRSKYLLSGLVRCDRCGGPMVANTASTGRRPSFRCTTAKERGPEACAGGYVAMSYVREHVVQWLEEKAAQRVEERATRVEIAQATRLSAEAEARRLRKAIGVIDEQIDRLTVQLGQGLVSEESYGRVVRRLEGERATLVGEVGAAEREARTVVDNVSEVAEDLLARWQTIPIETRRETLSKIIECVRVRTGDRSGVKGVAGGASNAVVTIVAR